MSANHDEGNDGQSSGASPDGGAVPGDGPVQAAGAAPGLDVDPRAEGLRRLRELVASMPDEATATVMRFDVYAVALGTATIGAYAPAQIASIRESLAGLGIDDIQAAVGPISGLASL